MLFILQVSILSEQTGNFGTKTKGDQHKSTKKRHRRSYSCDAKIWNDYKGVCEGRTPSEGGE